ncbi:MAG: sugar transferase [Bacteroidales bacterium]|nr:sugar transferase [Bacteroidales bacterium]
MSLFKRKKPWVTLQYDDEQFIPKDYSEPGEKTGAKLEEQLTGNNDLNRIFAATENMSVGEIRDWLEAHHTEFDSSTYIVNTDDGKALDTLRGHHPRLIINEMPLNRIRHLNTFLNKASEALADDGYLWCHSRTSGLKKEIICRSHPGLSGKVIYRLHYLWHRVCAKLKVTRWFYMWVTQGKNRTYNRVELLGRMYRAGFEVFDERFHKGEFFLLGRKVKDPIWDDEPTCGALVKLNRVGYHGNMIGVYKFRTMYSYSEYLQPYMLEYAGLQDGGKFAHDYRINYWGRLLRKTWLDEFPMLINILKGQMKLVGVRPLSRHYFSLYTPEMQALHTSVKPGLLPPFYYEEASPVTLEDVQASEKRYIEAYHRHPFRTDWRYFWGTVDNILFKHKRSH